MSEIRAPKELSTHRFAPLLPLSFSWNGDDIKSIPFQIWWFHFLAIFSSDIVQLFNRQYSVAVFQLDIFCGTVCKRVFVLLTVTARLLIVRDRLSLIYDIMRWKRIMIKEYFQGEIIRKVQAKQMVNVIDQEETKTTTKFHSSIRVKGWIESILSGGGDSVY